MAISQLLNILPTAYLSTVYSYETDYPLTPPRETPLTINLDNNK